MCEVWISISYPFKTMVITRSPLPQNDGQLHLPFFGGNYPIVILDNINNDCICILTGPTE